MTLQLVVFGVYFAVITGIGIQGLRLTRSETDYWIAGGKLGWLVGGATLAATHVSAGTFIGTVTTMAMRGRLSVRSNGRA